MKTVHKPLQQNSLFIAFVWSALIGHHTSCLADAVSRVIPPAIPGELESAVAEDHFNFLMEVSQIWPQARGFFSQLIQPTRQQFLFAMRIFKHWRPAISISSVYIRGDRIDQYYADPLSFGISF